MAEFAHKEWVQRGIPLKILRDYLTDLGGVPQDDGSVSGVGWQAHLERVEDFQLGSLRVGQVRVTIEGEQQVLEALLPQLEKKLLRAGA